MFATKTHPGKVPEGPALAEAAAARLAAEARPPLLIGVGGVDVLDANDGGGWDLLVALLRPEWQQRPTAEEALRHRWWNEDLFI